MAGTGLLGNWQPGARLGGLLANPGFQDFRTKLIENVNANSGLLSTIGAGLVSSPNMRTAIGNTASMLPKAFEYDQGIKDKNSQKAALDTFFTDPANAKLFTPGELAVIRTNPDLAVKVIETKLAASIAPKSASSNNTLELYTAAKAQGYTGSLTEFMTQVQGASGAQESAFGNLYFDYGPDNEVRGAYSYTNRGTLLRYEVGPDGKLRFADESRVPGMGGQGGATGATPAPQSMPAVPSMPGASASPSTPPGWNASSGAPVPVQTPTVGGGIRPAGNARAIDTALGTLQTTPGGAPIGYVPKDVKGAAAEQELGSASGKIAANLATVENSARRMQQGLDALINDKAVDEVVGRYAFGMPKRQAPNLSDSMARARAEIDFVLGNVFLTAYNDLRGAGAITEQEGAAAKAAYTKLQNTEMGYPDYIAAAKELKAEIDTLVEVARRKAAMATPGAPAAPVAPAGKVFTLPDGTTMRQVN